MQAKGQAQQQREQVERLREGAARHRSVAQSAQRRAAALQRSLALSQQVAVLQAQALAGACSAMLVCSSLLESMKNTPPSKMSMFGAFAQVLRAARMHNGFLFLHGLSSQQCASSQIRLKSSNSQQQGEGVGPSLNCRGCQSS